MRDVALIVFSWLSGASLVMAVAAIDPRVGWGRRSALTWLAKAVVMLGFAVALARLP